MTMNPPPTESSPALVWFSVGAGMLAAISAFVLGYTLWSAAGTPPPAPRPAPVPEMVPASGGGEVPLQVEAVKTPTPEPVAEPPSGGERPLPVRSVAPSDAKATPKPVDPPARVVINPRIAPSPKADAPAGAVLVRR